MLKRLNETEEWDIVIIGGGATGLGTAIDAASRGYKTLLLEQHDFAKGTSSRSTKLIHGGVRYLAQGNIKLVRESLKERGLLLQNAPHIVHNISFVLPCYSFWQKIYYGIGLKIYDLMAGNLGLGKTKIIGKVKTKELLPNLSPTLLSGGIIYYDGQFDDARLAINMAQTAVEQGGVLINYCKVIHLNKENKKIVGLTMQDELEGTQYVIKSKSVINATGIFTDDILKMDDIESKNIIRPSQGIHLVFDKKHFNTAAAMMIPKTVDGRVLFAVPWHDKVIVGTTDTAIDSHDLEPKPLQEEVVYILEHINKYLTTAVSRSDVKSVFAGLRPLVKKRKSKKTALMSRDHTIMVSNSGLVTITGGKWTTYRKMGEDAIHNASFSAKLEKKPCVTASLKIHGWKNTNDLNDPLHYYGSDASAIKEICKENVEWNQPIHSSLPNIKAEIIWAVRQEMAMTVEDVLARRTRILFLDAEVAIEVAPEVANFMAIEMKKDDAWVAQEIKSFNELATQYLLP